MDLLQTGSKVHALLFHLRVCGPHVNFRRVDRKALYVEQLVPYKGCWVVCFVVVIGQCWSSLVVVVGWSSCQFLLCPGIREIPICGRYSVA